MYMKAFQGVIGILKVSTEHMIAKMISKRAIFILVLKDKQPVTNIHFMIN